MIVIDRNARRKVELAWLAALLAELGHERSATIITITRKYLHSMIVGISNEQETSMMVEHQAHWQGQQPVTTVFSRGTDRELDSSITIKSIVSHLFNLSVSLSLSHNDKEMIQAPNCSNQRDEDMELSLTRDTRHERDTKQASNEQQEATRTNR